jgi:hypothetical protein
MYIVPPKRIRVANIASRLERENFPAGFVSSSSSNLRISPKITDKLWKGHGERKEVIY